MRRQYHHPLVVAVTGGIGTGQSTVCKFFEEWHCKMINADQVAKGVIQNNKTLQKELKEVFGREIFNKQKKLDTNVLAEKAFRNDFHTQQLNRLVHPRMVEVIIEEMEKARFSKRFPMVIIDAALIYEINIEQMFDAVVVVRAPLNHRQQRVQKRDGMTRRHFMERVSKQLPIEDKTRWADFVIDNNKSLDDLKKSTRVVYHQLMDLQREKEKGRKV